MTTMNLAPRMRSPWHVWLSALFAIGAVVTVAVVVPGPGVARGSIMIALDLPTLVQQADHIAVVDVTSVQAAWDERHERIYSTIELKVVESWKSPATQSTPVDHLTVVQAGGTVGDLRMTVTGMGTFVPGERSLVFLRGPANRAQVVGMTQGKRPMKYESVSHTWRVAPPDLSQAKLVRPPVGHPLSTPVDPAPSVSRLPTTTPPARDLPIEDVHAEIKRLLAAARQ